MFRSEEQKMKLYRSNLGREAKNQFKQGEALDDYLLYEKGIESQEKGTSKFAEAIGEQIGKNMRTVMPTDRIKEWAAQSRTAATLTSSSKATNDKQPKVADTYGVYSLDDNITATSKNKPKAIAHKQPKVADTSGVSPKSDDIIRPKSKKAPRSIKQPPQPKDITLTNPEIQARKDYENTFEIPMEQSMMSAEDTLSRLTTLNADQDYALRQKFDDVLDGIASQAKTIADQRLWKQMKAAIEKQRMADVYREWVETQIEGQFANKLQRNLKSLLNEKRANKAIAENKAQRGEQFSMGQEDVASKKMEVANKAATTIQQRMAELRARKAAKRAATNSIASTDATDIGSISDISFRGRPPTDNLAAKRLAKYQELESKQGKTPQQVKQMKNLQAQLFRKPMALEDKPEHRPSQGSNLRRK